MKTGGLLLRFPKVTKAYAYREAKGFDIFLAIVHWKTWLIGIPFVVISDHESLVLLDHGRNSRRIQRWLLGLSEYNFSIMYRRGIMHSAPDALSRIWKDPPEKDDDQPSQEESVF